jgi:hypothetical protein
MAKKRDWDKTTFTAKIRQNLVRIEAKPAKTKAELWLLNLVARMRQELDELYPKLYHRRYG